jgi:hypothetical protein
MKIRTYLLGLLGLCGLNAGCKLYVDAARNLVRQPIERLDNICEARHNRQLAKEAWDQYVLANPGCTPSSDYYQGFLIGFTDYLRSGGNGQPPVAAPWPYWTVHYQNPQGIQAMEDWFAGFRQGAAAAMQSGYRQYIVLPLTASPAGLYAPQPPILIGPPPVPPPAPPTPPAPEATPRDKDSMSHRLPRGTKEPPLSPGIAALVSTPPGGVRNPAPGGLKEPPLSPGIAALVPTPPGGARKKTGDSDSSPARDSRPTTADGSRTP